MKKFISLILVLVMVFSVTVFASAAGFQDVEDSKNEIAIEELYDLGVLEGFGDGKFYPNQKLTRAQACAIIVRAMVGRDNAYANTIPVFTDVTGDWYAKYVDTAYRCDYMHGYGNGTFGPEDKVTYEQFATIVVNMLGYNAPRLPGEWPTNVLKLAEKLDLFTNITRSAKATDFISREDVAQMLYNALDERMVSWYNNDLDYVGYTLREYLGFVNSTPEIYDSERVFILEVVENRQRTVNFVAWTLDGWFEGVCPVEGWDRTIAPLDIATVNYDNHGDIVSVDYYDTWNFNDEGVNEGKESFTVKGEVTYVADDSSYGTGVIVIDKTPYFYGNTVTGDTNVNVGDWVELTVVNTNTIVHIYDNGKTPIVDPIETPTVTKSVYSGTVEAGSSKWVEKDGEYLLTEFKLISAEDKVFTNLENIPRIGHGDLPLEFEDCLVEVTVINGEVTQIDMYAKEVEPETVTYYYATKNGSCYHLSAECSGMKAPEMITLEEAHARGLKACGTCIE